MKKSGQKLRIKGWAILTALMVISAVSNAQTVIKSDENKEKIVITKKNNTWKHSSKTGLSSFDIEYTGKIEVTDDDKDIKSISPGGYIEISKTTFGSKREILIEAASGGTLRKVYYEGRTKTEWEPAGRKWLAEILPDIVRSTGLAAESRVNRFYKQGGVNAVVAELSRLDGNYVVATYGKLLLAKDGLSNNDLRRALEGIAENLNSDYYLAEILKDNAARFLKNEANTDIYLEAALKIGSDYYASLVLKEALDSYKLSSGTLAKILEASKSIGSDYYQASLLSKVLELDNLNGEQLAEIIEATKDIGSDYYQSQILAKALSNNTLSSASFNSLIVAVSDVSSDYYMASVFTKLAENKLDEDVIIKMVELVDEKLSSDHYASLVLSKLMKNQDLSARSVEKIANAITGLGSSHYASSAIKSISKNDNLSKESLIAIIKAIGKISSDYYASSALESIAPLVKKSDESVKDAYRAAAKSINSDTYYGRAMRAID